MRLAGLALLATLTACAKGEASRRAWTASDSARVDALLDSLIAKHEFMGAVVLVRDGAVVYTRSTGYADAARDVPFTRETPTDGGSLAKTFTAAAAWALVAEGRLVLDTSVQAYVPEYPYAGTSVRHLLGHSNGLPPYYELFDPHFPPGSVRTTLDLLAATPRISERPRFTPGSRFEYSNLGFDVLALVVERVSRSPIADVFRERFFTPLGMTATFARPARFAEWPGARTLGHRWNGRSWELFDVYDGEAFIGASNLYFSAQDLARWATAHAEGRVVGTTIGEGRQPRIIIGEKESPITARSWYCHDADERCHYGGTINAFQSFVFWDRGRREAAVMVSNSNLSARALIALERGLVLALAGAPPDSAFRDAGAFATADGITPAGRWRWTANDTLTISEHADGLRWRIGDGLEVDLFPVGPSAFYLPAMDLFVFTGTASVPPHLQVVSLHEHRTVTRIP